MICEYYGKKCLYTPVALSLSCENCVVKMAYKNGVIKGREDFKRPHGEWIEHKWAEEVDGHLISNYECSCCHSWKRENSDFCPNCGADMREGGEEK